MEEVIMRECFTSGSQGKNASPKRFLMSWIIVGAFGCSLCLTVELLRDKINFKLYSLPLRVLTPFPFSTILTNDIEKIEIRKGIFGYNALISIAPKYNADQRMKTFFWVRKPKCWIEHFNALGLQVENIDYR